MSFRYDSDEDETKGKKNKLKIGQKVKAKQNLVDWFSSHFSWSYGKKIQNDDSYGEGEKEIGTEDLPKLYIWSWAKLSRKSPVGVVMHYGAEDNDEGIDRKNVCVEFTLRTGFGNIVDGVYVYEKDLVAVKKTKSRK